MNHSECYNVLKIVFLGHPVVFRTIKAFVTEQLLAISDVFYTDRTLPPSTQPYAVKKIFYGDSVKNNSARATNLACLGINYFSIILNSGARKLKLFCQIQILGNNFLLIYIFLFTLLRPLFMEMNKFLLLQAVCNSKLTGFVHSFW